MVKTGDILVCKKHYENITYNGDIIEFEINTLYKVSSIHFTKQCYNPGKHKPHIDTSYNWITFDGLRGGFSDRRLNMEGWVINNHYIWDYFYTLKDWRKIKLKKLQNESELCRIK